MGVKNEEADSIDWTYHQDFILESASLSTLTLADTYKWMERKQYKKIEKNNIKG
jgi:hypothetical protein